MTHEDNKGPGWPETSYDSDRDEFRLTGGAKLRIASWVIAWVAAIVLLAWWFA